LFFNKYYAYDLGSPESQIMISEPAFLVVAAMAFSLTAAVWWKSNGYALEMPQFWTAPSPKAAVRLLPFKQPAGRLSGIPALIGPTLSAPRPSIASSPSIMTPGASQANTPFDRSAQMDRLAGIVTAAVATAGEAERLHRAAHEQVDAADYALQNLIDELSAVIPGLAPAASTSRDVRAPALRNTRRPAYETALAA
jgi:hypothetical protein